METTLVKELKDIVKNQNFKSFRECIDFCLDGGISLKEACEVAHSFNLKVKKDGYIDENHLFKYVKEWNDIWNILNIKTFPDVSSFPIEDQEIELTGWKLKQMIKVFNNGWIKDWNNPNEYYYTPYFKMDGSFSYYYYVSWCTYSYVGLGWGFKSVKLLEHAVKYWLEDYKIYHKGE